MSPDNGCERDDDCNPWNSIADGLCAKHNLRSDDLWRKIRDKLAMGDHRASIKIEFTMHADKPAKTDMWINWSPDYSGGVDRRITEWFEEQSRAAMDRWFDAEFEKEELRRKDAEVLERAELARLQQKYGS